MEDKRNEIWYRRALWGFRNTYNRIAEVQKYWYNKTKQERILAMVHRPYEKGASGYEHKRCERSRKGLWRV